MTREEERKEAASCHITASNEDFKEYYEGFIEGAKWADENPNSNGKELLYVAQKTAERTKKEIINKACEWLKANTNPVFYNGSGWTTEEFIANFKKSMEK